MDDQSKRRFIVRGDYAGWMNPALIRPSDVDVTDIEDVDELAAIFIRERDKVLLAEHRLAARKKTHT
jgi:hypothetical protein